MDEKEIVTTIETKAKGWFTSLQGFPKFIKWLQAFVSESTGEGSSRRLIAIWAMVLITYDNYVITHILDHAAAQRIPILQTQADLVHFIGTTVFIFLGGIVTAMIAATTIEKAKQIDSDGKTDRVTQKSCDPDDKPDNQDNQ